MTHTRFSFVNANRSADGVKQIAASSWSWPELEGDRNHG